jgi:Acetyltransferase (GNAT) domain
VRVPARYRAGITRCTPADAADLLAFQLRTFEAGSREVDAARTAWLFDRNPCRSADATWDIYVCRREGEIVGQQAEIPFDLRVGHRDRRAAWTVDLMVDGEWRLRGVGPGLMATQIDARPLSFGLNLSEKGYATYTRSGWTDLGVVPVYLRPLDLAAATRGGLLPGSVGRIAPVAGSVLRAADTAVAGALRAAGARLVDVDRLDARTDEVWAAASGHYPVLARRDLAALAWRIDDRPDAALLHRHYLVVRGRPVGYAAVRAGGTPAAPTAVVVDYLAPPRWVAPLLLAAGRAARARGAVAMSVKTRNVPADRALRLAGFVRRERGADDPIRFMAHAEDDDGDVNSLVTDPDAWFVTSADSDLEYAMTPATDPGPPSAPTRSSPSGAAHAP